MKTLLDWKTYILEKKEEDDEICKDCEKEPCECKKSNEKKHFDPTGEDDKEEKDDKKEKKPHFDPTGSEEKKSEEKDKKPEDKKDDKPADKKDDEKEEPTGLTSAQKKLPEGMQKAILAKMKKK